MPLLATLSYKHINEFVVLASEAFLLFGIVKLKELKGMGVLLVMIAGMIAAIDIYIKKPPRLFC